MIAIIIGTFAFLAWFIDSIVWGINPSSAATTKITISVTLVPDTLIEEKASCPGVSIKVISDPWCLTWYAPIFWVIPPSSFSTMLVFLIASRSVVLPWSTCPNTVITGALFSPVFLSEVSIEDPTFKAFLLSTDSLGFNTGISNDWATLAAVEKSTSSLTEAITPNFIKALTTSTCDSWSISAKSPTVTTRGKDTGSREITSEFDWSGSFVVKFIP